LGNAPWEIIASDLSTRVLEKARSGHYPMTRVMEIPSRYLSNYCLKGTGSQEGTLLIEHKLRERVQFIHYNLTESPPKLGEFDVIFLRNVMIYFDQETKRRVVNRLLSMLRSGGHFLVGHSETLNGVNEELRLVQPAVYWKP
jgi:chemotaxis protein methyltransferase CheR